MNRKYVSLFCDGFKYCGGIQKERKPAALTIETLGGLIEELLRGGTHLPGLVEDVWLSLSADVFHQKDVVAVPLILLILIKQKCKTP